VCKIFWSTESRYFYLIVELSLLSSLVRFNLRAHLSDSAISWPYYDHDIADDVQTDMLHTSYVYGIFDQYRIIFFFDKNAKILAVNEL